MRIVIDLDDNRVVLAEPDDFTRFSIEVTGQSADGLADLVHDAGLGRVQEDGTHVVVDPVALRALAGSAVSDQWDEGFAAMVAYAASKGWVEADGGILAHIEWREDVP